MSILGVALEHLLVLDRSLLLKVAVDVDRAGFAGSSGHIVVVPERLDD